MMTYGVTMFGQRRHVMASHGMRVGWAKCGVDADYLPKSPKHPENQRAAAFPVCKRCLGPPTPRSRGRMKAASQRVTAGHLAQEE